MLARLGGLIHRYAITGLYTCLGLLNAQSWPYLAVFIAFGAAVDTWLVKPSVPQPPKAFELLTEEEVGLEHAKWYSLLPYVFGLSILGATLLFTLRAISKRNPDLLFAIGPMVYELAAPFINLLRLHYQDLLAHGLPERAAVVATNYAGMFLIFYLSLGPWLAAIKNLRLGNHPRQKQPQGLKFFLSLWLAPPVLLLVLLFIVHLTTWTSIDYTDENFKRRHINRNVAKYDSFIWDVAFYLGAFAALAPALYLFFLGAARRAFRRAA